MSRFLVVTGLPASGKSTVGAAIAEALGLPLLDKDEILEALFESAGTGDAEWRRRLSRAADQVLRRLALATQGAVLVSWWRHPQSPVESGTPTDWLRELPGAVTELYCRCSPRSAAERFFARTRHPGHLDAGKSFESVLEDLEQAARLGPIALEQKVEIDTERDLDLRGVLRELENVRLRRS